MAEQDSPIYALVLSGGGARGAYEAGVIYYVRTELAKAIGDQPRFRIYCGTSVGAINAAHMAATEHDPLFQGARLRKLWEELTAEDIYYADKRALTGFLVKSGFFMATNFFGLQRPLEKWDPNATFPFRSVLDTTPFLTYMRRNVSFAQIHRNIQRRLVDAVSVSASHLHTGKLALFVEKHPEVAYSAGGGVPIFCTLSPRHVLASASIPIIFPMIRISRRYYGDGGMRQNTPMSPAIHLGADRLLVISLRADHTALDPQPPPGRDLEAEPRFSNVIGHLLNTVFLDKLDYDLDQMRRINYLIQDFEEEFGPGVLERINARRQRKFIGDRPVPGAKCVVPFVITPSENIGRIAAHIFNRVVRNGHTLNPMHRFFSNIAQAEGDNDFMSYLLFEPEYLKALVQLGFEDARREHDRLVNFFTNRPLDCPPQSLPEG
ncbi:MAG TPA: patatin-like phospholipase family protein [bacterium]|nr:patatin-like phospholipase family protein [bacterium]